MSESRTLDATQAHHPAAVKESGAYKDIVSHMATNMLSRVINSRESDKEHEANKTERRKAKARRAGPTS